MPRFLLLPFAGLPLWLAAAYLFGGPERTSGATFAVARAVLSGPLQRAALTPMQGWGLVFLLTGVWTLGATLAAAARQIRIALSVGGALAVWWGITFGASALADPAASLNGPAVYGFVAFCYFLAAWRVAVEGVH